ncbi:MAG: RIP metalloprotease RseP, partial [Candidatus Rokubacteria bacterium]|nr:RIP metalloprotease RseP [Candidatus Rokubacteria bacterium]
MTTTIVSFVIVIGVLILIHEFGHFAVARLTGVGVERFSIGFGPVLLRWRGKETEYCLSALPLGGYVKMLGEENPLEGGGVMEYDPRKAFALKPLWARFLIVFAGPGMNFVLAAVLVAGVLATFGRPVWPALIGRVTQGGPAATAGVRTGDLVVAVNGRAVAYWEDLQQAVAASHGQPLTLTVRHDAAERTVTVSPALVAARDPVFKDPVESWDLGASSQNPPVIVSVMASSPAERAGVKPGDVAISVAGQPVYSRDELQQEIQKRPGQAFDLVVLRDGVPRTLRITAAAEKEKALS